ncbi:MAG: LacI family transcriptional regulator [Caldilineae bacterium]|nr:MAG: LacI family transcriptional regulator [Caldilineae bacterium]
MSSTTIRDVAKRAGVGVGTVSRVLNNHPSVREATRQRVEEAIAALNYKPNPIARQLSMGRSHNIAVIAPFFIRPSFVERLRGVDTVLAEHDYDLVLYNVEDQAKRDELYHVLPRGDFFDGLLILTLGPDDEEAERLQASGIPVVLIDAHHPRFPRVIIDDVEGGYLATRHLIELGHHRIAYISDILESPFKQVGASARRYEGYRRALAEAGIDFRPEYYRQDHHGVREAQQMAHALLELPEPPTAIFAASDTQAIGVLRAAEEHRLRVPQDLSVIGFDDIEVAEYLNLTTVHQPLFTSGVEGAELLIRMLNGETFDPETPVIQLPLRLINRQTTAPPPSR